VSGEPSAGLLVIRKLAIAHARQLLRDPVTFFFLLVFPFIFLSLFAIVPTAEVGGKSVDAISFGLPAVLVLGFGNLALLGTATTLVEMRSRGILRLFGVTPVTRAQFLISTVPVRLAVATLQTIVLLGLGLTIGDLEAGGLPRLLATCALGLLMFFALGFLAGGYLRSVQATSTMLSGILPVAMICSGIFVPFSTLPKGFADGAKYFPLTYLGDALQQDLVGTDGMYSIATDWLVIAGTAAVLATLAVFTFRWDQGE
jgi:ABC-2 type transport system permease protein